jgi:RNA polymerase sigma factor (sigma-70 family)
MTISAINESIRVAAAIEPSDGVLVNETLAGNRNAFERIVGRYQNLICALAYSATGSVPQSEDVAQETFVTAWAQLPQLREHDKLRAWLCGIARFTISKTLRKQGREPSHAAEPLDAIADNSAPDTQPAERMISNEEQALLWRAIEQIPENYREPLVLFYREHQSVEAVAKALEISEDAVKQRLSRGRKMLQQEVMALVEGGLARTSPGRSFTLGVLAALPALLLPAQAAAAVASGTATAAGATKAAVGSAGSLGLILGPFLGLFGTWVSYRVDLDSAGSDAERHLTKTFYRRLAWALGSWFVGFTLLMLAAGSLRKIHESLLAGAFIIFALTYTGYIGWLIFWWMRARRAYLAENPEQYPVIKPAWEYRTSATLFGLPLLHIRIGGDLRANGTPARGWIAIGDTAIGALFAFGGIAVAPLSIGGCAIGLLSFGGAAIGALALGGTCVGAWAFGGLAFGWQAFGGCTIALKAAVGGVAIAYEFAHGGIAVAGSANNSAAEAYIATQPFFRHAAYVLQHYMAWLNLIWVLPMIAWWRKVRKHKRTDS